MLEKLRGELLEEARRSPALLSDLAGLECYVAESYDSRSFIELLQNTDDAGASRFLIQRSGDFLFVANNGRPFTPEDFESLCRSAASTKQRGASIGYRGIGFKSVVGFAERIHLFSGELEATFSRERTAEEIPQATRVPLVRIPHHVEFSDRDRVSSTIQKLKDEGFHTIFVFGDLIASAIESEFAVFDATSLLFLRNIRQIELKATIDTIMTVRRDTVDTQSRVVSLGCANKTSLWTVMERDEIALGFVHGENGVARLDEQQAVVHAFLPTHDTTGFAVKINGDISTDPSRTRVIFDERTAAIIELVSKFIVSLFEEVLSKPSLGSNSQLLSALVPFSDPRMASFQRRSFKTDLIASVQRIAKGRFEDLRCRPPWLNPVDFESLAGETEIQVVPRRLDNVEGLANFLKYLGAREATLRDLSSGLCSTVPSLAGAAEVVAHITNLYATKQIETSSIDPNWLLWPVSETPDSLEKAKQANKSLDRLFTDLVGEKTGVIGQLRRLLADLTDPITAAVLVPSLPALGTPQPKSESSAIPTPRRLSLKRWRSAEQQVLELLAAQGWRVEDVSRQNIGYDIEGVSPQGEPAFVEVKAIENPGQPFILTSNEEAVARQKGSAYYVALVRQTITHLEVAFISDPANHLVLTRQCRQWVWECSSYTFSPERFALE